MENDKVILKADNIFVSYGVVKALKDVSFEAHEGTIISLIGPNNAGKSTLVGAVLGINKVSSGKIFFKGKDVTNFPTERLVSSGICLVPERRCLISTMTVMENLQLGAYHHTKKFKDNLEIVFEYFPRVKERTKQLAGTLSGGEQQMVAIARGLMSEPIVMMFDEPSLGLSPIIVEDVFNIINNLNRSGITIILSEQNAHKALSISQWSYVIERGSIVLGGASRDLINNKKVQHAYLGGGIE